MFQFGKKLSISLNWFCCNLARTVLKCGARTFLSLSLDAGSHSWDVSSFLVEELQFRLSWTPSRVHSSTVQSKCFKRARLSQSGWGVTDAPRPPRTLSALTGAGRENMSSWLSARFPTETQRQTSAMLTFLQHICFFPWKSYCGGFSVFAASLLFPDVS